MTATAISALRSRVASWALRRQGKDRFPVTLERRRIYILPGKSGIIYALILLAMMLASINYGNSMAFMLTFLLAGLGLVSMHGCHRNLAGTVVRAIAAEPVFAGQDAIFQILLYNPDSFQRVEIRAETASHAGTFADLDPRSGAVTRIALPTRCRGQLRISRIGLATRYPLLLFRSWVWLHHDIECLVYPAPATSSPMPPTVPGHDLGSDANAPGDEDFAGLRNFQAGDSPGRVAWKALARSQNTLVKQFTGSVSSELWLDWYHTEALDNEDRLSRLCRLVLDAEKARRAYGLRLPGVTVNPSLGDEHLRECLSALALFPADKSKPVAQ